MISSLRRVWRSWSAARSSGLLAVAAIAIGIGSTTAIYSVVHAVLLNPLPYANPDRYYLFFGAWRPRPTFWTATSYADFVDYAARQHSFDALGVYTESSFNVLLDGRTMHANGAEVSPELIRAMGVAPTRGRLLSSDQTALISESLWRRLGSDPNIAGKQLSLDSASFTVAGVMPGWFQFPIENSDNDVWISPHPDQRQKTSRNSHYLRLMGKLKPGVTVQQAVDDLQSTLNILGRNYRGEAEPDIITAKSVLDFVLYQIRPVLVVILCAAGALLLIACANVASLLLARSVARARDTAVRVALGATNWQLGLHYFSEGLVLSSIGAGLGLLLSFALMRGVLALAADEIPRSDQIGFDWQALAFALGLAVVCGILFSLAPLWQARRIAPNEVLSEGVRASAGAGSRRLLRAFVIAEVTLAFGLLTAGGVLYEQATSLARVNPGFDIERLTVIQMNVPYEKYLDDDRRIAYEAQLSAALANLPGIEAAGFINLMPIIDWGNNTVIQVEGQREVPFERREIIENRFVGPGYFQAMKIPLISGRFFTGNDRHSAVMPLLINQTLARLYWKNGDPIGAYVKIYHLPGRYQVVGVVGDVRNAGVINATRPEFYLYFRETAPVNLAWAVRSPLPLNALTREARAAVQKIELGQSIYDVRSMREILARSISRQKLEYLMVSFFGISALVLAVLGVYGVVAYAVRQRITEFGTRMAIGATPRDLLKLVLGNALRMAGIGVGVGCIGAIVLIYFVQRSELKMDAPAWPSLIVAAIAITICILAASWFPAWRATMVSPMVAIRSDLKLNWSVARADYRVLTERVTEHFAHQPDRSVAGTELLAAIADVSRHAESFAEAIHAALETLSAEVGASGAFLLTRKNARQPFRLMTVVRTNGNVPALPPDSLLAARLKHYSSALPFSERDLEAWKTWAVEQAPRRVGEIETLLKLNARLAAVVLSKEETIGIVLLGEPLTKPDYRSEERRLLWTAAAQLGLMLENASLTDRILEQERLRRELMVAAEVQRRLFPESAPAGSSLQIAGVCMPARGVGGDYYDFLDLGNKQVGIALADVAGKGIAAALIMSVVQASLRSLAAADGASLAELASKMNRLLHRSTGVSSYATFFYAQFDEERRRLRYVNAGHNPPFLLRSGQVEIEELSTGGMIIGMFPQLGYEEASLELGPGDTLMLFSDGVSEAHNPAEEEFGDERLKDLLRSAAHLPIPEMSAEILGQLKEWMADAPQHDDLTFVVMKVA